MTNAVNPQAGLFGSVLDRIAPAVESIDLGALARSGEAALPPVVVACLAVGLALWLVGDRLFRPAASLVGAVLGAAVGFALSSSIEGAAGHAAMPYAVIGGCALLGLGVGSLMYRLAVGLSGGLALAGLAGGLTAALTLAMPGGPAPERPETLAEAAAWREAAARVDIRTVSLGDGSTLDTIGEATRSIGATLASGWETLPHGPRNLIAAAAILGCVIGLLFGTLRPRVAGPMIASLTGAGLWLGATTVLLIGAGRAVPPMPAEAPAGWLGAWLGVALIGFLAQRRMLGQMLTAPKPE